MVEPLTLWLTDRSRYTTGVGQCPRRRYYTNHFGETGYGIVRKAESMPLATGKYTHLALERIFVYLKEHDSLPTDAVIRAAIQEACLQYDAVIEARGFAGLLQSERSDQVIVEQKALVEGLVWAFSLAILPWLHREYRVLEAETETIYILGCTCGLGSAVLDPSQHQAKGCQGVGQMLKQDVIAEGRRDQSLVYFETKTTGWAGDIWAEQWETKPQLALGSLGIEERYGRPLTAGFVLGLAKGARKKAKDGAGQEIVRQDSPLVYGYRRPANPPLSPEDWLPSYEWVDESGQTKRASRAHQKAGVWELALGDWPVWTEQVAQDPTLSPSEVWVKSLPQSVLTKQVFLCGPLKVQQAQVEALKEQVRGEEARWQEALWTLYQVQREHSWGDPAVEEALNRWIPASWECRRFGAKHQCEFVPICFKQEGWQDPIATGHYVPRRPHHQPELDQAISRGLLPETADEGDGEEE